MKYHDKCYSDIVLQIKGTNYSIRSATLDDLGQVLQIEEQCYKYPWSYNAFEAELEKIHSCFFVLTDDSTDSQVIAYLIYYVIDLECHLLNVAVSPHFQRLGIGTYLTQQMLRDCYHQRLKRAFLEVRKSNEGAVQLYQNLGFFIDHIKKQFYTNGEDAYFMVNPLP